MRWGLEFRRFRPIPEVAGLERCSYHNACFWISYRAVWWDRWHRANWVTFRQPLRPDYKPKLRPLGES